MTLAGTKGRIPMKVSTIVLVVLNVVAWGGLVLMGRDLLHGVVDQHVSGDPNRGQIQYYLYVPLGVLTISAFWPLLTWKLPTWARNSVPVIALLFLPIYLFSYTGGM
jgi:hypothetical protein